MREMVKAHIQRSIEVKRAVLAGTLVDQVVEAGLLLAGAFRAGQKVLLCGNGGSAGDAQHIATEFVIRYQAANKREALPAISLATDTSALTAGGNDLGFDLVFARQVEALGRPGDVLIGITTSGNSPNIIEAFRMGRSKGMRHVLLSADRGGRIMKDAPELVDIALLVPSQETARIQECHIMLGQILCAVVEKELYGFD